jgi:hypothetical protein
LDIFISFLLPSFSPLEVLKKSKTFKNRQQTKEDGGVVQVVECLPCKSEALSSNPVLSKKKKKREEKQDGGTSNLQNKS